MNDRGQSHSENDISANESADSIDNLGHEVETEILIDEDFEANPYCPLPSDFSRQRLEWKQHFSRYLSQRSDYQRNDVLKRRELFSVSTWDGRSVMSFRR